MRGHNVSFFGKLPLNYLNYCNFHGTLCVNPWLTLSEKIFLKTFPVHGKFRGFAISQQNFGTKIKKHKNKK